jgi:hypothetical protein
VDRQRGDEVPGREFGEQRLREDRELVGDTELRAPRADGNERKEQARQEYVLAGFPQESFDDDWPAIRSRLASEEIARRLVVDGAEPRDLQEIRRGWWGGWIGLVIVAIVILWLWWIAIWGWGAWGNNGVVRGGVGAGQNQPAQQAPQNPQNQPVR